MSLRKNRELTSCCRGGAVIEFVLVLPILLLILFGIIEFSVALYDKAVITNASREATRAGILSRNAPLTEAQIRQVALDYCADRLISFGSNNTNPIVSVVKRPHYVPIYRVRARTACRKLNGTARAQRFDGYGV